MLGPFVSWSKYHRGGGNKPVVRNGDRCRLISERGERGTGVIKAKQSGTPSEAADSGKRTAEQAYIRRASLACVTLLQGKWRVHILCAMRAGPVRLGQLVRLIPNVSRKMLVQNLRKLEGDGIVIRRDLSDVLLHVEYDLAPGLRESICLLLDELSKWSAFYSQKSIGEDHVRQDGFGTEEGS
jgi:DNA-binding HxlR family transcriptional regulator